MQPAVPGDFQQIVYRAGARAEVRQAVAEIYSDLQAEIQARRPRCDRSGRCCRFEEFGHRLYVTTMELANFVYQLETESSFSRTSVSSVEPQFRSSCPFQVDNLCGVHEIRPFGCRVFFCDSTADDWQHAQYERFHTILKQRHAPLGVPYYYLEWRNALAAAGVAELSPSAQSL